MEKWSVMDLIGLNSEPGKREFEEIYLSPYEVEPSEDNFYSQENIEELADAIRMVGQQQPTVLGCVDGVYKIISGHRRNLANIHNIEIGVFPRDYQVKYLTKDMTPAMMELSLIVGNAFNRRLTPYEETEQAARLKAALLRARDEDGVEIAGKLRDIVADLLQTSQTKVARMDKINNGLVPEAKEQFKAGSLGPSAAYETAKLPQEDQKEIAAKAAAGEEIKHKDIAERVAEKKAEEAADRENRKVEKAEKAEAAFEGEVCTAPNEPEAAEQPDLPLLKNNELRAAFVDAYETWPLWIETVQTGERYYRYDLEDGTSMVVKVYHARLFAGFSEESYENQYREGYGRHEYYLLRPGKFFRDCDASRSLLIEKLKEIQKTKKGKMDDEN